MEWVENSIPIMRRLEPEKDRCTLTLLGRKKGHMDPRKVEDILKFKAEGMSQTSRVIGSSVSQLDWDQMKSLMEGFLTSKARESEGLGVDPGFLEREEEWGERPIGVLCL